MEWSRVTGCIILSALIHGVLLGFPAGWQWPMATSVSIPVTLRTADVAPPAALTSPHEARSYTNPQWASVLQQPGRKTQMVSDDGSAQGQVGDYVSQWRAYIEQQGSALYRYLLAKNPNLAGRLQVKVSIDHSGELLQAHIVQSSGSASLDALALATIRQSAPFPAFPESMRDLDQLDILRTWVFEVKQ